MEHLNSADSLQDYQKKMSINRRIISQAFSAIQRAKQAGIPEKYMRIPPSEFINLLDPHFHKDRKKVTDYIYNNPLSLMKKEFIVIDGGSLVERQKAGYAILFRLISCNKRGACIRNAELSHKLQSIKSLENELRNDLTEYMRNTDLLFISEVVSKDFANGFDTGRFYDEILSYRDDHCKTTIISFLKSLSPSVSRENTENSFADLERLGQYICLAGQSDQRRDERFLRIRVKINGSKQ